MPDEIWEKVHFQCVLPDNEAVYVSNAERLLEHLVSSALSSEMDDSIEDFRRRIAPSRDNEALSRALLVQTTIRVEDMHFRMEGINLLSLSFHMSI